MALTSGTKLGPYEIQSPLGAGGMGEVYRAKDTRLDRTVAIKVLPSHLSSNPDLKQRFDREARAISSLNHPRICTLHDVGHQDGIDFLVMQPTDCGEGSARCRVADPVRRRGRSLLVADSSSKDVVITVVDLATGLRRTWKRLSFSVQRKGKSIVVTPDLKYYAYYFPRYSSDLYLVENLR